MGQIYSRTREFFEEKCSKKRKEISPLKTTPTPVVTSTEAKQALLEETETLDLSVPYVNEVPSPTPRPPIRSDISVPEPEVDRPITPPRKKRRSHMEPLEYHILQNQQLIDYIKKSKVMVILRGLSGSGKTTIAKAIADKYSNSSVCSADDYFMKDGVYEFNAAELKYAHESCRKKTEELAKNGTNVIVIDNTNIKLWEFKKYLEISKKYDYVNIFLEPKTSWAKDPEELSKKTTHDIGVDLLKEKLKVYQPLAPLFYGWFINEADSRALLNLSLQWLKQVLDIPEFLKDFKTAAESYDISDLLLYYEGKTSLHCTSKFTQKGKAASATEYMNDPKVIAALGSHYLIDVIGFVITPRTFGARIQLSEAELELWGQDDEESLPDHLYIPSPMKKSHDSLSKSNGEVQHSEISELNNSTSNGNADHEVDGNHFSNGKHNTSEPIEEDTEQSTTDVNDSIKTTNNLIVDNETDLSNKDITETDQVDGDESLLKNIEQDNIAAESEVLDVSSSDNKCNNSNGDLSCSVENMATKEDDNTKELSSPEVNNSTLSENNVNNDSSVLNEENDCSFSAIIKQQEDTTSQQTLKLSTQNYGKYRFAPTFGLGSRAHMTLGTALGVPPVVTGHDLISVVSYEQRVKTAELTGETDNLPDIETYTLPGAVLKKYNIDTWVIYPQKKATMSSLFTVY